MDKKNAYKNWKASRSKPEIPDNFSDSVMQKIYQNEADLIRSKKKVLFRLYRSPLIKAGMIIAAAAAGFIRIILLIYFVLEL